MLEEKLNKFIRKKLLINHQLFPDEDLIKVYALDSIKIMELVVELEEEFEIEFPDEMLEIRNFKSINCISEMISKVIDNERGNNEK